MAIRISHKKTPEGGIYLAIADDDAESGRMTYRSDTTGDMIIEHTKVSESCKGQGIGELLIRQAIDDARSRKRKIVPVCSYAVHYFEKNTDIIQDILREK